jgi:hypothetical protein
MPSRAQDPGSDGCAYLSPAVVRRALSLKCICRVSLRIILMLLLPHLPSDTDVIQ